VLVLKQFLYERGFDRAYTGGLSSYALVLLVTRFLQDHQDHQTRTQQQAAVAAAAASQKQYQDRRHQHHHHLPPPHHHHHLTPAAGLVPGPVVGGGLASRGGIPAADGDLGHLLTAFLRFYGREFEPRSTGVSVLQRAYTKKDGHFDPLHIEVDVRVRVRVREWRIGM
jgi:DNA polymerase sigma